MSTGNGDGLADLQPVEPQRAHANGSAPVRFDPDAPLLAVATAIITESTLSFLGFGVQPPQTSWGRMLADAEGYVGTNKAYLLYFPGLAILITVLAVNYLGDGLRDAFDPRGSR